MLNLSQVTAERDWYKGLLCAREELLPAKWGLSHHHQTRIMGCLMSHPNGANMSQLVEAVYWDRDEPAAAEMAIKVSICDMRKKLVPFRIEIINNYGGVYYLRPNGKAIVLMELAA